ncbi:MAG: hypothetical protein LBO74_03350 [Candidatus Symbiothrix sp.]|jgi:hypothetical protein|nr:hypothetical protein [Candidatus Symbiothrix sp.]
MITKKENIEFGMTLTLVLLVISWWLDKQWLGTAILCLLVCLLFPCLYTPFTKIWFGLAKGLEGGMSKVILFLIFFLVITPVAGIRRMLGKDSLNLRNFAKNSKSIWVERFHSYTKNDLNKQF